MKSVTEKCRCDLEAELEKALARHEGKKDDLIELLYWVQENYGYVPKDVQVKISEKLNVPLSTVQGVITFYHLFSLKPKGKYEVSVCKGTACYVRGAPQILDRLEKELDIKPKDTTDDNMFSLEVVRCLGACGLSPVVTINGKPRIRMKPELVPEILQECRNKSE